MLQFNVDLGDLMTVKADMQAAILAISQEMTNAGTFIRDVWVDAVSGTKLPGMTKAVNDDQYARSIRTMRETNGSSFSVLVGPFGYDNAQHIEEGTPAYDMKPGLLNGPKSRALKDGGGRYNIVPFRHMTPTNANAGASAIHLRMQMPKNIYKQAKQLARSILNPTTGKVDWNQSLRIPGLGEVNPNSGYQRKTNQYDGMYRVGYDKHSQYVTFRAVSTSRTVMLKNGKTIQKGSAPNSWIHPAMPANPIMQAVYHYCIPRIETNLDELIRELFT